MSLLLPLLLQLRDRRDEVSLIHPNHETRIALGKRHPEEATRRERVAVHWGMSPSPRQTPEATIDEALDPRTQSILYYQLPENVRREINRAAPHEGPRPRQDKQPSTVVKLRFD